MSAFEPTVPDLDLLRKRAFNLRWAEVPEDTIPLTAADLDFPAPLAVREALVEYVQQGYLCYGPPAGLPEFREAAARHFARRDGVSLEPERIVAVDSAASGMVALARTHLEPGDEMIVFDPVDFLFAHAAELAGARPVHVPLGRGGALDLDALESAVTPRTRMIGLCQPHNPLGRVFRRAELEGLLDLCERHDLWILSDEIWSDIVHAPAQHRSMLALGERARRRTLLLQGTSKAYGLAGVRIGFVALPDAEQAARFVERSGALHTSAGASTLSQVAAIAAWEHCQEWLAGFVAHLTGQRDLACERLGQLPGVRLAPPEATFVVFPDVRGTGMQSEDLARHLLERARVAVVPGAARWFGPAAAGHIRLALATTRELLTEALDRIEAHWPARGAGTGTLRADS